ncbi:hypothetical protein NHH82_01585 [Oxalobacteraceae bacterium OTU3REALA1]|nr:hypothetical protein NHH82_01585 [Oxalobacteraceae bacterium OTU3REALA1]
MSRKIIPSVVLAVLAGFSSLALADPPAVVGRISAVQGQVTLVSNDPNGDSEPVAASLNWPVTGANHINTASGARTEFRVGSTAVRLDGDSDLEITDMDEDLLRMRLNYGSVSIRVRSPELLRDFELTTPQARITMIEPGLLRVDVERVADTSQVSVMGGSARVDGAGSSVVVSNGRQVDVSDDDVRTGVARRDGFDVWADERDRQSEAVVTSRYVSSGITGYEELDRNGSWTESAEYGPLWAPRNVAVDWAPYRDGRWTWLAPWGWTWVDNAPWGYAPSHYGRWVTVNRRWFWAPGRPVGRPVWAPALVGWVGGDGFSHHRGPGLGWFPLSPRERYVPNYRVSNNYENRMTWYHNGKPYRPRSDRPDRRDGVTMLPRDQFEGRHTVPVNRGGVVIPPANLVKNAVPVAPPAPGLSTRVGDPGRRGWPDRDGDGRPDRFGRNDRNERNDRNDRNDRFERNNGQQPGRVITAPSQPQPQVQIGQGPGRPQTTTTLAPGQFGAPNAPAQTINPNDVAIELRPGYRPRPQNSVQQPGVMPAPILHVNPNRDRFNRDDDNGRRPSRQRDDMREAREREQQRPAFQPQPQPQPHQVQMQPQRPVQPQQFQPPQRPPQPQPQVQIHQPQPQAQPQPRPQPAQRNEGQGQGRNNGNRPTHNQQ